MIDDNILAKYDIPLDRAEYVAIDKEVEREGFETVFKKYLGYLDCTRIGKVSGMRLQQTIGYPYMHDMSKMIYLLDTYNPSDELYALLNKRHQDNLAYEKDNPPIWYDKKHSRATFEKKYRKKAQDNAEKHTRSRESSASKKLKAAAVKLGKLKFKIE